MNSGVKTIIYPVGDLETATKVFSALVGAQPSTAGPYYVGFNVDGQHVGLDPNGHSQGMTGPVGYWHVDDIKTTLEIYTHISDEYLKKAVTRLYSNFTPSKRNHREQWGIMRTNSESGRNPSKALLNQLITSD